MGPNEGSLIALGASATALGVLSAYGVNVALFGRPAEKRLDGEPGTALLGRFPIEAFHWAARGVGRALERTGISPDALTVISAIVTALAIPLAATGRFEAAGVVLLLGSAFDALDGIVARQRKIASDAGEMLDATIDRYADAFCLSGLAIFYRESALGLGVVLAALIGSMMVSYVRAKGEALGLSLPPGLMRRPERIAYLAAALLGGPLLSSWLFPSSAAQPITLGVVGLIALVSNASALRSMATARALLRARGAGGAR